MIKEKKKGKEKISHRLNEILIERIRKCQTQNISQLINSPNDEDTNNSFLGGLLYFDGEQNNISAYEINNDLDKITVNDIYIESFQYDDYNELSDEEEEEENENIPKKNKNKNINKIKYDFKNDENNLDNINTLLIQDFNHYLDLIQKDYKIYENNHFPKLLDNDYNNKILIKNPLNTLYETKKGEKIAINDKIYQKSIAYLNNQDLFYEIPPRYQREKLEFTLDYNLLEENIDNIQKRSMELIDINSRVATSITNISLYSYHLDKYIKDKLDPFNNYINNSFEKIKRDKYLISEIKAKTLQNAGNIILRRLKMNNIKKTIAKLKKYKNLKNSMNSLELLLISDPKKSQEIYDLINKCKEEIEKIKNINNLENSPESLIGIFENKLNEFKNRNDAQMSQELAQILNKYFNNFLIIENKNEIIVDKKEKFDDYKKYGITEFVLEKVCSISNIYEEILTQLYFSSPQEDLEKVSKICDYYIEGKLINNIYIQLKGIFTSLNEQVIKYILSIFRETLDKKNNNIEKEDNKNENKEKENENKENENYKLIEENNNEINNITNEIKTNNENNKNNHINLQSVNKDEINESDEIFILLCILLSKNKLNSTLLLFIKTILTKVENSDIIDKNLKENIIKECNEIKNNIQEKTQNVINIQIQNCLHKVSLNIDIDIYINNYYLILELIRDEHLKNSNNNTDNNSQLSKIIIKEQLNFIDNWAKTKKLKFESNAYKSWDIIKEIPQQYQKILNVFFSFDIESNCMKDETIINKYPLEKLNLIKEALEEEDEEDNEEKENNKELLIIKDGDKPQFKIKATQTSLEIINFSFDLLKMFIFFHKECYGNILGNAAVLIISHLNFQIDMIYDEESDIEVTHSEISMTNCIFLLIQYIYDHIRESDFFVEIAKNSNQKLIESYFEITKNINNCFDKSKYRIEDIIDNKCIKESLDKLEEIELPNYYMVSGDFPVKEYALMFVSSLKDIYQSMSNSYEESFIIEMVSKALEEFFDKFEDFIFHGQKIEEENCLKQFKRDMIFLKKNLTLVFNNLLDISDIRNRIDNINKSVLPESMLTKKK